MNFSIIVPVYGVEKYLDECVQSLLNQTYADFEVILVDDRSPDNCPAMCDSWQQRDSRVRVIHKPINEGLGFARNTGIEAAKGDYILFVDSDDYIAANTLESCAEALKSAEDILVFGMELRYEDAQGAAKWYSSILPDPFRADTTEAKAQMFSMLSANKVFPYACNKAYRREFLMSVPTRFEQTKLIEDFLFNISVFSYAKAIVTLPQPFYTYRKPAHETLASRYSPEFFELSKRKYLLEEEFLKNCDALAGDALYQVQCRYIKHLISTIIKNKSKAAGLTVTQQKNAIREMVRDSVTVHAMEQMQPVGLKYTMLCSAIRNQQVNMLLMIGCGVSFMQQYLLPLYRRFI